MTAPFTLEYIDSIIKPYGRYIPSVLSKSSINNIREGIGTILDVCIVCYAMEEDFDIFIKMGFILRDYMYNYDNRELMAIINAYIPPEIFVKIIEMISEDDSYALDLYDLFPNSHLYNMKKHGGLRLHEEDLPQNYKYFALDSYIDANGLREEHEEMLFYNASFDIYPHDLYEMRSEEYYAHQEHPTDDEEELPY